MPEFLSPGVFIEETSFRNKSIEGISTDTAAFVGPTRRGPSGRRPALLTSWLDFERIYGTCADLRFATPPEFKSNHVALAVRYYFENGGRRLYVARTRPNRTRTPPSTADYAAALATLQPLDDLSTLAAPGCTVRWAIDQAACQDIQAQLLAFAQEPGTFRFAVLDPPPGLSPGEVRTFRGGLDSSRAALYYPWVTVANPLAATSSRQPPTLAVPPSGFLCGIYAGSDLQQGVFKAPANVPLLGALGPELTVSKEQQDLLNPEGINCLRVFEGLGFRVWGARTVSSDPEWKYLSTRRYFNYLEGSIARSTQWAVFEPNGERLWANVRQAIADFLYNEWRSGALLGSTVEEAFFVRCDRSTMTQNDLDNGRLICLIGVAIIKPAEFVIFRIGQKTADARS